MRPSIPYFARASTMEPGKCTATSPEWGISIGATAGRPCSRAKGGSILKNKQTDEHAVELREPTAMTWQGWLLLVLLLSSYLAIYDRVNPVIYLEPNHSYAE